MSRGGDEHLLEHGGYTAVATEVGGGLRRVCHGGRDLVRPYDADEVRPRFRGSVLLPWPNRVADGRYRFGGEDHQLALTEPERGNALHGLVCWVRFSVVERDRSSVTLGHRLVPQQGYPFDLDVTVRHALDDDGLTTTVTTRNVGTDPAPYGVAPHPYLVAGPGPVDDWTLRLPVAEVLEVTPDRLLPLDRSPVAGTDRDFRTARVVGTTELDHAFTGVVPDEDGRARVVLHDAAGLGVTCTWDPAVLPWIQVHTGDLPLEPGNHRRGLAVEPMSCPPDAFNGGEDLVVLPPGGSHTASWTIGALPPR
ncbi:aldose 1-epimerase family protein [Nocardioides sp. SOB77]|uniref:Aldose 1-epimerase family protein n=1 Tax=Nocardioides oceani TaxID=3058369 RepID=A0ABT8FLB1_9ACTN|nr:aldose 1-epimerase family protein [Nocardioides oceani]MDN4175459.1 aldose 1-epimerase family protein [Nocardioides oceani]